MSDQLENLKPEDLSSGDRPVSIPPELPVLPLRDTVLFPNSFRSALTATLATRVSVCLPRIEGTSDGARSASDANFVAMCAVVLASSSKEGRQ